MAETVGQGVGGETSAPAVKKKGKLGRALKTSGLVLLLIIILAILVNSLLVMFKDDYYTTFGKYRLFAIVSDSMEPTIPKGSMIVDTKPGAESEIKASTDGKKDGTVITFKYKSGDETVLLTHRVVRIEEENNVKKYITRGDNAGGNDSGYRVYSDIVGVYTGKKAGFFGSLFGFFQSALGVSVIIFALFIIVIAWIVMSYVDKSEKEKEIETAALKKSAEALSSVNLRYDNIHEITAVMDVLGMVTDDPHSRAAHAEIMQRLNAFIRADNIELPQTPETAAILDSLPAPDTPGELAAALAAGATLRQAEDGETLVLTTMSGGKNILLTPVQTADGVILCQQGARLRSDLAPNIEEIGISSMPASPEFFEGQPLEKNVVYPELPQPDRKFSSGMINATESTAAPRGQEALSAPKPVGAGAHAAIGSKTAEQRLLEASSEKHSVEIKSEPGPTAAAQIKDPLSQIVSVEPKPLEVDPALMSRLAFARYREQAAANELKQAAKLHSLLDAAAPLSEEEKAMVAAYKAEHPAKKRKPRTEEQKQRAKQAAEKRVKKREEFLAQLGDEERELYLTEEKLSKSRESAIRRLRRMAADRKILDGMTANGQDDATE